MVFLSCSFLKFFICAALQNVASLPLDHNGKWQHYYLTSLANHSDAQKVKVDSKNSYDWLYNMVIRQLTVDYILKNLLFLHLWGGNRKDLKYLIIDYMSIVDHINRFISSSIGSADDSFMTALYFIINQRKVKRRAGRLLRCKIEGMVNNVNL